MTWQIVAGAFVLCYALFVILLYFGMFGRAKEADGLGEQLITGLIERRELDERTKEAR